MNIQNGKIEIKHLVPVLKCSRWIGMMLLLPLMAAAHFALAQTTEPSAAKFDHIKTGFNLTGAHVQVRCESCHLQGMFKGTPRDCASCHMSGNRMGATAKPGRHVITNAQCDNCHRTMAWTPASFSHVGVMPGGCLTCHNGSMAAAKPLRHILTTESCDKCHRTSAWTPAGYNHAGIAPGICTTCHGTTATGVPNGHMGGMSPGQCDGCHRTSAWLPAYYNHVGVVPGTCATCHNGSKAKGMTSNHIPTTGVNTWISCDSCHKSTISFANARLHSSVVVTKDTCTQCHEWGNPYGLQGRIPNKHTSGDPARLAPNSCDNCHTSTSNWNSGV